MEPIYMFNFLVSSLAFIAGYFFARLAYANGNNDGKLFGYGGIAAILIIGSLVLWGNNFSWVLYW